MEFIHKRKAEQARNKELRFVFYLSSICRGPVCGDIFGADHFDSTTYLLLFTRFSAISDQAEARRQRVKAARQRRDERQQQKKAELLASFASEDGAGETTKKSKKGKH